MPRYVSREPYNSRVAALADLVLRFFTKILSLPQVTGVVRSDLPQQQPQPGMLQVSVD